jgi:hypothetical protein
MHRSICAGSIQGKVDGDVNRVLYLKWYSLTDVDFLSRAAQTTSLGSRMPQTEVGLYAWRYQRRIYRVCGRVHTKENVTNTKG